MARRVRDAGSTQHPKLVQASAPDLIGVRMLFRNGDRVEVVGEVALDPRNRSRVIMLFGRGTPLERELVRGAYPEDYRRVAELSATYGVLDMHLGRYFAHQGRRFLVGLLARYKPDSRVWAEPVLTPAGGAKSPSPPRSADPAAFLATLADQVVLGSHPEIFDIGFVQVRHVPVRCCRCGGPFQHGTARLVENVKLVDEALGNVARDLLDLIHDKHVKDLSGAATMAAILGGIGTEFESLRCICESCGWQEARCSKCGDRLTGMPARSWLVDGTGLVTASRWWTCKAIRRAACQNPRCSDFDRQAVEQFRRVRVRDEREAEACEREKHRSVLRKPSRVVEG
ncbi:MAG: hypothetical protein HYZ53_20820 [Planctomycetes bacterium]|nr:hypothetical protein [Planctomycetota bacterium]